MNYHWMNGKARVHKRVIELADASLYGPDSATAACTNRDQNTRLMGRRGDIIISERTIL